MAIEPPSRFLPVRDSGHDALEDAIGRLEPSLMLSVLAGILVAVKTYIGRIHDGKTILAP
jgi:hypothetical protein